MIEPKQWQIKAMTPTDDNREEAERIVEEVSPSMFYLDQAPNVQHAKLKRDHLIRTISAALSEKDQEIVRLQKEVLRWTSIAPMLAKRFACLDQLVEVLKEIQLTSPGERVAKLADDALSKLREAGVIE